MNKRNIWQLAAGLLMLALLASFAFAAPKKRQAKRRAKVTISTTLTISPAERQQILRSREFSLEQIEMARAMKWLLDYSGEELEAELMRRKAKGN